MRKITIGQFQKNIYKEINDLPFIISRAGEDYCVVTPLNLREKISELENQAVSTAISTYQNYPLIKTKGKPLAPITDQTTQDIREQRKCQAPNANCRNLGNEYRLSFYETEGLVKKELFLCGVHLKKAQETCEEVVAL